MKRNRIRSTGLTCGSVIAALNIPRGIPEIKEFIGRMRSPKDVTVETAIRHLLMAGMIEVIDKPYHCYEARLYRVKGNV